MRRWCGTLKRVVWYFEEDGVGLRGMICRMVLLCSGWMVFSPTEMFFQYFSGLNEEEITERDRLLEEVQPQ